MWKYNGRNRPDFAEEPREGQESVWDYPRPPRQEQSTALVVVSVDGVELAHSRGSVRVLETASPPTVYLPPSDVHLDLLRHAPGSSWCEWKGQAKYWALSSGGAAIAWSYPQPSPAFANLKDFVCFYPGRATCILDGERVQPQPGGFYGGWLTSNIVGPVKGEPGTGGW